jgi:hypothetical protein
VSGSDRPAGVSFRLPVGRPRVRHIVDLEQATRPEKEHAVSSTSPNPLRSNAETPRTRRRISVMSSGTRARRDLTVAGTTRRAELVSPERSFSYTQY